MPLTWIHNSWDSGSYETDRNEHVARAENRGGPTGPYYDGSIAIAFGYDLLQRVHTQVVRDPVTHSPRYTGTAPEIVADLNLVNRALGLRGAQRVTITQDDRLGDRYRRRYTVERTFSRLGNFRRIVARYENHISMFVAFFQLACVTVTLNKCL
jgi:hypothetical protein